MLKNSIKEKDNAEKSPFTKLFLLLINRELSVKGLFSFEGFLSAVHSAFRVLRHAEYRGSVSSVFS